MFLLQKIIDGITLQSRMEFLAQCIVVFVMLMQNAPIVREWVGLRPVRKNLRIEHEVMKFPSGSLQVPIHCDALFGLLVAQDFTLSLAAIEKSPVIVSADFLAVSHLARAAYWILLLGIMICWLWWLIQTC